MGDDDYSFVTPIRLFYMVLGGFKGRLGISIFIRAAQLDSLAIQQDLEDFVRDHQRYWVSTILKNIKIPNMFSG